MSERHRPDLVAIRRRLEALTGPGTSLPWPSDRVVWVPALGPVADPLGTWLLHAPQDMRRLLEALDAVDAEQPERRACGLVGA